MKSIESQLADAQAEILMQNQMIEGARKAASKLMIQASAAKQIMTDALCCQPAHAPHCVGQNFANLNRNLPSNHPVWAAAPACNCWVGQLGEWLKAN